ncbi:sarcoplasmic calcium-binding protein 1-like [Ctenocephalides felis]|uniref:sarcoplasmic calcium-binding protein 1-like n=1 Tax=Ctenocephalides felis TaxID=7515 RepID=UPI000E6E55F6|nr:sarcoplasmic calcium-binding protein 1-like [Ctenocephalides felis]
MAYSWDNRVTFLIDHLYDVDHNGYLNRDDFLCTALRSTVRAGLGSVSLSSLQDEQRLMLSLWEEIADIADLNQDGIITVEEFKQAVQATCVGKHYEEFPQVPSSIRASERLVSSSSDISFHLNIDLNMISGKNSLSGHCCNILQPIKKVTPG